VARGTAGQGRASRLTDRSQKQRDRTRSRGAYFRLLTPQSPASVPPESRERLSPGIDVTEPRARRAGFITRRASDDVLQSCGMVSSPRDALGFRCAESFSLLTPIFPRVTAISAWSQARCLFVMHGEGVSVVAARCHDWKRPRLSIVHEGTAHVRPRDGGEKGKAATGTQACKVDAVRVNVGCSSRELNRRQQVVHLSGEELVRMSIRCHAAKGGNQNVEACLEECIC
jgi:hypothetical protein